jgi:hypothetical protein
MADLNQLYDALRKADAAGNVEDAKRLADYIRQVSGAAEPVAEQKRPEDVGFFEGSRAALGRGVESFGDIATGYGVAGASLTGDTAGVARRMEAAKAEARKPEETPGLSAADIGRIYEEKGLLSAAGQVPKYISEQVLQSAPQMAVPLAAGAAATPFLTPVGGALVGMGTYALQQFGNFLFRQAQEKEDPQSTC